MIYIEVDMNPLELFIDSNGSLTLQEQVLYLRKLSDKDKKKYLNSLEENCISFLEEYKNDYKNLQIFAYTYAVDLYRVVNYINVYFDETYDYLSSTAYVIFNWFKDYGLQLHLLISNDYYDFDRPLNFINEFLLGSGLTYISPYYVAFQLMKKDGLLFKDFVEQYPNYKDEAVIICDKIVNKCINEHYSYIYLDINEDNDNHFKTSLSYKEKDGHIVALKATGPEDGKGRLMFSEKPKYNE